jgi:hypothetical protein
MLNLMKALHPLAWKLPVLSLLVKFIPAFLRLKEAAVLPCSGAATNLKPAAIKVF